MGRRGKKKEREREGNMGRRMEGMKEGEDRVNRDKNKDKRKGEEGKGKKVIDIRDEG